MPVTSTPPETLARNETGAAKGESGSISNVCAPASCASNDATPYELDLAGKPLGAKVRLAGAAVAVGSLVIVMFSRALSSVDLRSLPVVCPMRILFGIPCPTCGMTTSFAHLGGLRIREAFFANPAGPLVLVALVVAGAAGLAAAICGRMPSLSLQLRPTIRRFALASVVPILGMMWTAQLLRFGVI